MSDSLDENAFDPAALEALLHDVPLELTVELGRIRMSLSELAARLGPGSIITLDTATGAPLDVRVNNRLVARAEAIAVGEKCGIRIVELLGSKDA
jgi:flagellar motor switch protein FliN/FliY